ncbi:MAG TPA: nuclear transport factor 2 family protein [Chitinophagaceae bacterium]
MKSLLTPIVFLMSIQCIAQQPVIDLAEAERSFSRYAGEHNTREAFLRFMDSGAVVFSRSGEIQDARKVWEARPVSGGRLAWGPSFVVLSTAGDLGLSTGTWTFRKSATDTVVASGEFTTIWTKRSGEWKWLVDLGVDHNLKPPGATDITSIALSHPEKTSYDAQRYMLIAEDNFIRNYTENGKSAYNEVADENIYMVQPWQLPVAGIYQLDAALVNLSGNISFRAAGSGVSADGDLGYVYGYAEDKDKKGNYLRVWRRIGRKWTLLLQTITI